MSVAIKQDKATTEIRERILRNHTLEAVFSMPDKLFYPKGVITSILVLTAKIPHPKNKEVFFGYFKDDGYVLKKHKGRLDNGTWIAKKNEMIDLYRNRRAKVGLSVMRCVSATDEWCAEAYMETDYSELNEKDFTKVLKDYVAFQFLNESLK
jgi:type I restriction-modification system DNA methylase subunit